MPVIGTAGHVDHGKSTLVEALTGRDPDRWEEEKRRGLTIDLGFAWMTLSDGTEVSFVDVPGHERFIKNMLAGTEAIDVALFVVAADEGWMPQSEEHLAVLDLLGVRIGVVAVTKVDRVDEEMAELVMLEARDKLQRSSLEEAPILPVAAPSGRGIAGLEKALVEAVGAVSQPGQATDRPRLWIDRCFSISGAGTVLTGTLLGGPLRSGDQVAVWPGPQRGRIRGLQSHEMERDQVGPGNRVAVNVVGLEREQVHRGAMLGRPGDWQTTDLVLVTLRTARYVEEPLTNRGAYHLHVGSGAWPVRLRLVEAEELTEEGAALLRLPQALPLAVGDRFILRDVGRRAVVGGGQVLDPAPPPHSKAAGQNVTALRTALDRASDERATTLLVVRQRDSPARLTAHSGGGIPSEGLFAGDTVFSPPAAARLVEEATALVTDYHLANPLRPGYPKASLASRLGVDLHAVDALVESTDRLRDDGASVAAADFHAGLSPQQDEKWVELRDVLRGAGLNVPRIKELDLDPELLHALLRDGKVVRVSPELLYLPEQLDKLQEELETLPEQFTVARFRDRFAISRKYAVPLLEWLDAAGVTTRDGDLRRLRGR